MAIGPKSKTRWAKTRWANVPDVLSSLMFIAARPQDPQSRPGTVRAGDVGDGCYRLDKGLLKVMVTSTRGEERIVAILGPGALVGELAMIDRMPRSASVVALRDSVLRFISRQAYEKRVLAYPETKQALLEILAFRLRQADEELAAETFLSGKARVASALLELAEFVGPAMHLAQREDRPRRSSGDGRRGAGKRQPRAERMASAQSRDHRRPAGLRSQRRSRAQARNE
jgi:CRP/FNR family transcriptional regulator, cyclic AMP receptor protein